MLIHDEPGASAKPRTRAVLVVFTACGPQLAAWVLVLFLLVSLLPVPAWGTTGTLTITGDTTLTEDHFGNIVIDGFSPTILDCDGYTVIGPGAPGLIGGIANKPFTNFMTVTNCVVTGFPGAGIRLSGGSNHILSGNTAHGNFFGFQISGAHVNILQGNTAHSNDFGFSLSSSGGNLLQGNTARGNDVGFEFILGFDNSFFHNNIFGNAVNNVIGSSSSSSWHHPVLLEGNFWGDYTGADDGSGTGKHAIVGDGIGDTLVPHHFDNFPFVTAFGWEPPLTITDLGTLGGGFSEAFAINGLGQVVGQGQTVSGDTHAFLWQAGVMMDLGTLSGTSSVAHGINEAGQVVGLSEIAFPVLHAFLWESGVMIDLGTLGAGFVQALGINEVGQVVGVGLTAALANHAFLWESGVMTDLGTLPGAVGTPPFSPFSVARGINDAGEGEIVGFSQTASGDVVAFLRSRRMVFPLMMTGLGTLGGTGNGGFRPFGSDARGINEAGQVVGRSQTASEEGRAFLWRNFVMTDLGTLGGIESEAHDINDLAQVVGSSATASGQTHATLWSTAASNIQVVIVALQTLGGTESAAFAGFINPDTRLAQKILGVVEKLEAALQELAETPPDRQGAVVSIKVAVGQLEAVVKHGLLDSAQGTPLMDQLAGVARQLAADALALAQAQPSADAVVIGEAQQFLAEGDTLRALGAFKDAVNRYKDALAKAAAALAALV